MVKYSTRIPQIQRDLLTKPILISENNNYGYNRTCNFRKALREANLTMEAQHIRIGNEEIYFTRETADQACGIIQKILYKHNFSQERLCNIQRMFLKKEKFIN